MGPPTAVAAWLLGAHPAAATAAGLLFLLALLPLPRGLRLVAAALAPWPLTALFPLGSLFDVRMAAALPLAFLAWLPLFALLGGRMPWQAMGWTAGAALLAVALLLAGPWGAPLTDSDISARAQALLLGAAALLVMALAPLVPRWRVAKPDSRVE